MPIMKVEVTDTFRREANYGWVRRYEAKVLPQILFSDRQCVTLAKRLAGWTGLKCDTENHGDDITLRPRGMCQIMFITFESEEEDNVSPSKVMHKFPGSPL